jgi:hypothetical protein
MGKQVAGPIIGAGLTPAAERAPLVPAAALAPAVEAST